MALRSRQLQTFATLKQLAKLYRCAQGYNQGLYPHVWYIIFHDFLSLLQWWWSCSWLPPPHPHPTRQPPNTNNFFTPMYDTSFFTIFWARHNGEGPAAGFYHPNFFTPMYDTSFFMIFWARHNDDGPTTDFLHTTPTPPTTLLILKVFLPPCIFHDFLNHNDSPTADFHYPTCRPPKTD